MTTRFCKVCFEPLKINTLHSLINKDICICQKCFDALAPKIHSEKINDVKGIYLFTYNDAIKEKIYALKGCGDIELSSIFLNYFKNELKVKYKNYIVVPSPSNETANKNREFNHVVEIFKELDLLMIDAIYKKIDFKQSDLKRNEREKVKDKLGIKDINRLRNKKVLFVDDISTTGSTLRACLNLLKSAHPKKLSFLIIAKVGKI